MYSTDYCEVEMQEIESEQRDLDEMEILQVDNQTKPLLGNLLVPTNRLLNKLTFSSVIRDIFSSTVHKQKLVVVHQIDSATQCAPFQPFAPYPTEEV